MKGPIQRLPFVLASILLLVSLVLPLWYTHMEAVQYQGDEALLIEVYASRVEGDLKELNLLNTYVGVELPTEFEELRFVPWILGALMAIGVLAALTKGRLRRWMAVLLVSAFVGLAAVGTVVLYQRLHQIGHDRGPSPFARVDNFMPPLIGTKKIANFTVHTGLGLGGWAFGGAFVGSVVGLWSVWRRRETA